MKLRIISQTPMKFNPEDITPQKGFGPIKEYQSFKFQCFSENPAFTLFLLDVQKFDADWAKDKAMYVGKDGVGQVKTCYDDFDKWITAHPEYVIITPYVYISEQKQRPVGFTNGRHRFSVLRDYGLDKIWVTIDKTQLKDFQDKYS